MRQALDKAPLCYLVSSHLWSRALSLLLSLCEETDLLKKPPFFPTPCGPSNSLLPSSLIHCTSHPGSARCYEASFQRWGNGGDTGKSDLLTGVILDGLYSSTASLSPTPQVFRAPPPLQPCLPPDPRGQVRLNEVMSGRTLKCRRQQPRSSQGKMKSLGPGLCVIPQEVLRRSEAAGSRGGSGLASFPSGLRGGLPHPAWGSLWGAPWFHFRGLRAEQGALLWSRAGRV